jgi:hypothetical protein
MIREHAKNSKGGKDTNAQWPLKAFAFWRAVDTKYGCSSPRRSTVQNVTYLLCLHALSPTPQLCRNIRRAVARGHNVDTRNQESRVTTDTQPEESSLRQCGTGQAALSFGTPSRSYTKQSTFKIATIDMSYVSERASSAATRRGACVLLPQASSTGKFVPKASVLGVKQLKGLYYRFVFPYMQFYRAAPSPTSVLALRHRSI